MTNPLDLWMAQRMTATMRPHGSHSLATSAGLCAPGATTVTPEEIQVWQMGMIRQTLRHARTNSPFYRSHLKNISEDAIRTPQDLANIPCITADDIRHAPENLLCLSQDSIARIVTLASSGSTGVPKRLFFTQDDLEQTIDFFHQGIGCLTNSGEHVLALLPAQRPDSVGRLLVEGVTRFGATAHVQADADNIPKALSLLKTSRASCIVGTPLHLMALAKTWRAVPVSSISHNIHSVLCCWDSAPPQLTDILEDTWNCKVHHHWGMTETGLGGALECSHRTGLHLREADIYVEIVDPHTGTPLQEGETGEIVVTTLARRGMPLIRYRTGDSAFIINGQCACNSPLRRLSRPTRMSQQQHPDLHTIDKCLLTHPYILEHSSRWEQETNTLHISLDILPCTSADVSHHSTALETQHVKQCLTYAKDAVHRVLPPSHSVSVQVRKTDGTISTSFAKRRMQVIK